MPWKMRKVRGGYRVTSPSGVRAKRTSKRKAKRQMRLLRAIDHGFKPRRRKKR